MTEHPEAPRVALVSTGEGPEQKSAWFVEIGADGTELRFALVGGNPEDEWALEEVLTHGDTVGWFRLVATEGPRDLELERDRREGRVF